MQSGNLRWDNGLFSLTAEDGMQTEVPGSKLDWQSCTETGFKGLDTFGIIQFLLSAAFCAYDLFFQFLCNERTSSVISDK